MRFIICSAFLLFLTSCSSDENTTNDGLTTENLYVADSLSDLENQDTSQQLISDLPSYSFETFETEGLGWGYRIYQDEVLFINQPHIPAIQGNKGFSSEVKAETTAAFAIKKMEQGFVPPTISPEELDSLGVLN